jgi:hypothetical protein
MPQLQPNFADGPVLTFRPIPVSNARLARIARPTTAYLHIRRATTSVRCWKGASVIRIKPGRKKNTA